VATGLADWSATWRWRESVLVCHGALDPHVPMTNVVAFTEEMTAAGADWQVNVYGGAMHGFTHAHAVEEATPGVAYHPYESPLVRGRTGLPGRSTRCMLRRLKGADQLG